jgi:hypothetical protein
VLPQNGGRPPPRNEGDGLPIERLGNRLDDEFISPNLSAQRAAVPRQGLPRKRLAYLAKHIRALGEGPLFEILRDLNHLVVAGVNACFRARGRGEAPAMPGRISVMSAPRWRADPQVGFIAAVIIVRGRRHHRKADIEDFVDRLVEATASGEAATTAPNPHRTPAKKRLRVGGVVTG